MFEPLDIKTTFAAPHTGLLWSWAYHVAVLLVLVGRTNRGVALHGHLNGIADALLIAADVPLPYLYECSLYGLDML